MQLFNTLTKKKEQLNPIEDKKIRFYQCGPTVYWTQHIGNLRAMTVGDLLARTLHYFGYHVNHVRNYTDVGHLTSDADMGEDKMAKGAKREGLTPDMIANKYIDIFEEDTAELNILEPNHKPRATEYVKQMIQMVGVLLKKGYAYTTDLAVYFDVSKFKNYTALSGQKLEENKEGAGSADVTDVHKKHPVDFALWFFRAGVHQHALQYWPSPFTSSLVQNGEGFPGWHIECSAMSKALLGNTLDIHLGGIEHISVHHTNEIAQSEAANGVKFVNYWLHNEHLLVNGAKMAKSEGTGYSLAQLKEKGFHPLALRYFFLQAHYRSQQNFTWEGLQGAETALNKLLRQVIKLKSQNLELKTTTQTLKVNWKKEFVAALEDDLNVPQGLAIVWQLLDSDETADQKLSLLFEFDNVLGFNLKKVALYTVPRQVVEQAKKMHILRKQKKYQEADTIRTELSHEYEVLSTNAETLLLPKEPIRYL